MAGDARWPPRTCCWVAPSALRCPAAPRTSASRPGCSHGTTASQLLLLTARPGLRRGGRPRRRESSFVTYCEWWAAAWPGGGFENLRMDSSTGEKRPERTFCNGFCEAEARPRFVMSPNADRFGFWPTCAQRTKRRRRFETATGAFEGFETAAHLIWLSTLAAHRSGSAVARARVCKRSRRDRAARARIGVCHGRCFAPNRHRHMRAAGALTDNRFPSGRR